MGAALHLAAPQIDPPRWSVEETEARFIVKDAALPRVKAANLAAPVVLRVSE